MKNIFYILLLLPFMFQSCGEKPQYKLQKIDLRLDTPHQVNVLFRVVDAKTGKGIPNLTLDDFIILEDRNQIGSEASAKILPYSKVSHISLRINTFLVIDNSRSMRNKLDKLKEAAKNLIDISPNYHYYSLYVFSSKLEKIQGFSNNKTLLKQKIDEITIGTSSTNLYGALEDVGNLANNFPEMSSLKRIVKTNIIVFSDGDDTQGSVDIAQAQRSLKNKSVYLIGTGEDLRKSVLSTLGNFYPLNSIRGLRKTFSKIQGKITDQADSYYWLFYQSPKRGDKTRILTILFKDNNKDSLSVKFSSKYFTD